MRSETMQSRRPSYASTLSLFIGLLCLPILAPPLAGQPAFLVRDIDPSADEFRSSSQPRQLFPALGKLFFTAISEGFWEEVWVSDGTANGTRMLAAGCAGDCFSGPKFLGTARGLIFWASQSDLRRQLLWRSDGTRAGTFPLTGPVGGSELVAVGSLAYFRSCDVASHCGLWRSDGTNEGTRLVMADPPGSPSIGSLTAAGGKLFFTGAESLWIGDNTPAGASRLAQFSPHGGPSLLTGAGDRLFFVAKDEAHGEQLWMSDGTAAGTRPVTAFKASAPLSGPRWLKPIASRVYFLADDGVHGVELWRSDGTAAGTVRLTDFAFASPFDSYARLKTISQLDELGGAVLFIAADGTTGWKLWRNDGTPASTTPLAQVLLPGSNHSSLGLARVGDRILFSAEDATHGVEPWSTDGTLRGTAMLHDICPGSCSSPFGAFSFLAPSGDALFVASSGHTPELWRSDGTAAGTRRVAGLASADLDNVQPAPVGGNVFFAGSSDRGEELWKADVATGQVQMVRDIRHNPASGDPHDLLALQNRILFAACPDGDWSLWQSDGSPAGTVPLARPGTASYCNSWYEPVLPQTGGAVLLLHAETFGDLALWKVDLTGTDVEKLASLPHQQGLEMMSSLGERHLAPLGNQFYFLVWEESDLGVVGSEIWQTDGTATGTHLAVALPAGVTMARHLGAARGRLYFTATGPEDNFARIWTSDGTAAGTFPLTDTRLVDGVRPQFTELGSRVVFLARTDAGLELWKTDGTAAGTSRISVLADGLWAAPPSEMLVHGGAVFFALSGDSARQIWRSDGTEAGTSRLASFAIDTIFEVPAKLTLFHDRLFFTGTDPDHGTELWESDGTAAGTGLFRDIAPGPESSAPDWLHVAGDRLYFAANDSVHGTELWQSDGTAAGTHMVQDIAPELESSSPAWITDAGGTLYFSADDGWAGRELWAMPLAAPATCVPSATSLCLGGRFRVEASWRLSPGNAGSGTAVPLTGDTGYFWFFSPQNVEVVVKVLDGRGTNGHYWVFYGALSDVEYALTVTDTQTGLTRRYVNLPGQLASVGDTDGFGPLGAFTPATLVAAASPPPHIQESVTRAAAECQPGPGRLCLNANRFAVEVSWKDFAGNTGTGKAVGLSGDTGYFWFFGPDNVEVMVKVLDGRPVNGKYWVFFGALSNVEYRLTVTDTTTGKSRTYLNPKGTFASVADTAAF